MVTGRRRSRCLVLAHCFGCRDAKHVQHAFGELAADGPVDICRAALGLTQQAGHAARYGGESHLRSPDSEAPGSALGLDVAQRAWRQRCRSIHEIEAATDYETRYVRVSPAKPPGDPE
jgi:hypothetical protein